MRPRMTSGSVDDVWLSLLGPCDDPRLISHVSASSATTRPRRNVGSHQFLPEHTSSCSLQIFPGPRPPASDVGSRKLMCYAISSMFLHKISPHTVSD